MRARPPPLVSVDAVHKAFRGCTLGGNSKFVCGTEIGHFDGLGSPGGPGDPSKMTDFRSFEIFKILYLAIHWGG